MSIPVAAVVIAGAAPIAVSAEASAKASTRSAAICIIATIRAVSSAIIVPMDKAATTKVAAKR